MRPESNFRFHCYRTPDSYRFRRTTAQRKAGKQ